MIRKRVAFVTAVLAVSAPLAPTFADDFAVTSEPVGRTASETVTPVNQIITPAGTQVELPGIRPNALALSPNGKVLVTSGLSNELIAIDPASGRIVQHVPFRSEKFPGRNRRRKAC